LPPLRAQVYDERVSGPSSRIVAASASFLLAFSAVAGCTQRLPAPKIAGEVALEGTRLAAKVSLDGARPFRDFKVDERIDGRAVGRREDYLTDAKRKGLDDKSLERAFRTASAAPEGAAAITVEVRPGTARGRKIWILVQAWGYRGKTTDKARVWLIDASTGRIVDSASGKIP
jgi:hypothetical protein